MAKQRVLVVGASGGVGRACALAAADAGYDLALTYRGNEAAVRELAEAARARGVDATIHRVDLADRASVDALFADLAASQPDGPPVVGIVHAAGSRIEQPYVSRTDPDDWKRVIDADVNGFFHVVHAGLPTLRAHRGSLVFVSSAGIGRHPPGDILSVAPKAACEALVRAVAREEGRYGVRANSVRLGIIDTGMFPDLVASGELDADYLAAATRNTPLRRYGTAEEVAGVVLFLLSSAASYVTGQAIALDGGYSI